MKYVFVILLSVVGLILLLSYPWQEQQVPRSQAPAPIIDGRKSHSAAISEPLVLYDTPLIYALFSNEVRGEQVFRSRVLITGYVLSVETGSITPNAYVQIGFARPAIVTCEVSASDVRSLVNLQIGHGVLMSGERASRVMGEIFFRDCLVEDPKYWESRYKSSGLRVGMLGEVYRNDNETTGADAEQDTPTSTYHQ